MAGYILIMTRIIVPVALSPGGVSRSMGRQDIKKEHDNVI
jgi:hypothetical protein